VVGARLVDEGGIHCPRYKRSKFCSMFISRKVRRRLEEEGG